MSDCRSRCCKLKSQLSHITFMKIDHEIMSTAIISLLLIQEGYLSVTQLDVYPAGDQVAGLTLLGWHHSFVEILL